MISLDHQPSMVSCCPYPSEFLQTLQLASFNFLALGLPKSHHIRGYEAPGREWGTTRWRVSCSFYPLLSPSMPTLSWLTYHHFPASHLSSHCLIYNLESWLPMVSLILKFIMKVGFHITYSNPTIKHLPYIITIIYRKLIDNISCKINLKSKLDLLRVSFFKNGQVKL